MVKIKSRSRSKPCKPLGNRVTICQERREARLIYAEVHEEGVGQRRAGGGGHTGAGRGPGARRKNHGAGMPTRKHARHELQIVDLNLFVRFCPVRAQKAAVAQGERQAGAIRARPRRSGRAVAGQTINSFPNPRVTARTRYQIFVGRRDAIPNEVTPRFAFVPSFLVSCSCATNPADR